MEALKFQQSNGDFWSHHKLPTIWKAKSNVDSS